MEGTGFTQPERRGLHHNNSHVGHIMLSRNRSIMTCNNVVEEEMQPELMGESDDEDEWDDDDSQDDRDENSEDKDDSEDGGEAISVDDGN